MILARIQAHPDRSHLHARLAASLGLPVEIRLHRSDPPDPWSGYRACLSDLPDCSHLLVIQDDALPCANFGAAVYQIAERHPDTPVCLFMGDIPASTALLAKRALVKGKRYIPLLSSPFVPIVAVLWPRQKAKDFLAWSTDNSRLTRADDGNAGKWMRAVKQPFLVTIPSLVEHNDHTPSVKGGRDHVPGAESWRRALLLAQDALDYEW